MSVRLLFACALLWSLILAMPLAAEPLLELHTELETLQGRDVVHSRSTCWLETESGQYLRVDLSKVTEYRIVSSKFQPLSVMESAAQLRKELGRNFEIVTSGKYVIAAPPGRAKRYGALLDEVYRSTQGYFSRRGFRLTEIELPLVAIIFPNQNDFLAYAKRDQPSANSTLQGYYDPLNNRIAFYDAASPTGGITDRVQQTVAHEAIHQFGFNTGLTRRLAPLPTWLNEGLAINLELEHGRQGTGPRKARVHQDRLDRYEKFVAANPNFDLAEFLCNSEFSALMDPLDTYAISWAITFYLMESRSADFSKYLKHLQHLGPLDSYSAADRLADFQSHFGQDVRWFQVNLNRFTAELAP